MSEQSPGGQGRWDARQGRFVADEPVVSGGAVQGSNMESGDLIYPTPGKPKNLALAALLGLIVPGLGHFYIGQHGKGALILFGGFFACLWMGGLMGPMSAADAYTLAQRLEEGHPIGRWQWFWEIK